MGSSRDNEARWFLIDGNSVVLTGGVVAAEPEVVGDVGDLGDLGDLGASELSSSTAGGFFSTEGTTIAGAVAERLGGVRAVMTGETLSLAVLTVDSVTMVDVGLGRAKPWVRFDSLSLMFVGGRISFLGLATTGGDGLTEGIAGEALNGELLSDLISMRGFAGRLRPEAFDIALPGLRG